MITVHFSASPVEGKPRTAALYGEEEVLRASWASLEDPNSSARV